MGDPFPGALELLQPIRPVPADAQRKGGIISSMIIIVSVIISNSIISSIIIWEGSRAGAFGRRAPAPFERP